MGLLFLTGGARSGKSSLALRLAAGQRAPVVFVATGEPNDPEMAARIERHRGERTSSWRTIEEPLELRGAIEQAGASDCLVVDCLTLWTANALEQYGSDGVELRAAEAAAAARARVGLTIVVTNEVGSGIVPVNDLARSYRDLLGKVNAIWAEAADDAYLVVAGRTLQLASAETLLAESP
jgi:adenosylcobinamide kinase / adenosylcobinamide-phosphate guanylyltransferase